jgi:hypothetical protein
MAVERIQEFIAVLKQAKSEETIKGLCKDEVVYLGSDLALTSKRRSITRYRNAIKELDPNHVALQYFKLSYGETRSYKASYKKQIKAEQSNLKPLAADDIIIQAETLLESNSYLALALGLMLLSGRRATEILKTASFEPATEYSVIFSGQLKTKGSENAQTAPYEIPLLTSADRFLAAFSRLRQLRDFSTISNDEVNRKCAKSLSDQVKKHFWKLVKDSIEAEISRLIQKGENLESKEKKHLLYLQEVSKSSLSLIAVKDLRAAYITIAEDLYNLKSTSQDVFFANVLGHSEDDLATAQSYKDFYII